MNIDKFESAPYRILYTTGVLLWDAVTCHWCVWVCVSEVTVLSLV